MITPSTEGRRYTQVHAGESSDKAKTASESSDFKSRALSPSPGLPPNRPEKVRKDGRVGALGGRDLELVFRWGDRKRLEELSQLGPVGHEKLTSPAEGVFGSLFSFLMAVPGLRSPAGLSRSCMSVGLLCSYSVRGFSLQGFSCGAAQALGSADPTGLRHMGSAVADPRL